MDQGTLNFKNIMICDRHGKAKSYEQSIKLITDLMMCSLKVESKIIVKNELDFSKNSEHFWPNEHCAFQVNM